MTIGVYQPTHLAEVNCEQVCLHNTSQTLTIIFNIVMYVQLRITKNVIEGITVQGRLGFTIC